MLRIIRCSRDHGHGVLRAGEGPSVSASRIDRYLCRQPRDQGPRRHATANRPRYPWETLETEGTPLRSIAVEPNPSFDWVRRAVVEGGAQIVASGEASGLIWTDGNVAELARLIGAHKNIRWVQLPSAGIESFRLVIDSTRVWTCAKGAYSELVAEHALALTLAGFREIVPLARDPEAERTSTSTLYDARVTIVGGGGVATALCALLAPFRAQVTIVRRKANPVAGAIRVLLPDHLDEVLSSADLVVLAAPLTVETDGLIDIRRLALMRDAWLVNVGRGRLVRTDDLLEALRSHRIRGAALDVTEPEPLPPNHPLREMANCILTPHVANTDETGQAQLADRIRRNVTNYIAGKPLLGVVDPLLGY